MYQGIERDIRSQERKVTQLADLKRHLGIWLFLSIMTFVLAYFYDWPILIGGALVSGIATQSYYVRVSYDVRAELFMLKGLRELSKTTPSDEEFVAALHKSRDVGSARPLSG